ncbi:MAG: ATP-binding protein [Fimbriimonadaceae bacterium]|nr:ATP-binding protein [Fimbriimonadaceae bacterium]
MNTNLTTAITTEPGFVPVLFGLYHARRSAFLLEHANDLCLDVDGVSPIEAYVPDLLLKRGFELVLTYSLSRGAELHTDVTDRRELERRHARVRQLSGLRLGVDDADDANRDPRSLPTVEESLRGLDRLLRQSGTKVAVVLHNLDRITPQPGVAGVQPLEIVQLEEIVEGWGSSAAMRATENLAVGLTRSAGKVSEVVRKAYAPLDHPLPDRAAIADFLARLEAVAASNPAFGSLAHGVEPSSFANVAAGLRLTDIEAIFRNAGVNGRAVNLDQVRQAKASVIAELADGGLTLMDPLKGGFESLAGIDHVAPDLREIARLFRENPASGNLPRALLLVGPPGTGKSSLARALAAEAGGVNVVAFGEVMGSYVGESERRMDSVLRVVEGMAPVIVFMDEVDTTFVARGEPTGDSGTSKRVLGKILAALGDERLRGKALFVMASNRGDLIDAALLRRCQKVYLVSTPGTADRARILDTLAQRDGRSFAEGTNLAAAAAATEGASGADLEKILARAGEIADRAAAAENAPLDESDLAEAIAQYKPNRDEQLHEFFDLVGLRAVPFLPGIPWYDPERGLDTPDCPPHVRRLLDDHGRLDVAELNRRIAELSSLRGVSR